MTHRLTLLSSRGSLRRALLLACLGTAAAGCGPRVRPSAEAPADSAAVPRAAGNAAGRAGGSASGPARAVLVGEMCPAAAAGRAAVVPLYARGLSWKAELEDVTEPLRRSGVRQFSVFGARGTRVGVFAVAGAADIGIDRPVGFGGYAGGEVCATAASEGKPAVLDPACVRAVAGCGLAIGAIEAVGGGTEAAPYDEAPAPLEANVGVACLSDERLTVDIDGDGVAELFRAGDFVDPVRAPSAEVSAIDGTTGECAGTFQIPSMVVGDSPKHLVRVDLLGVIDLDGDGRRELALAFIYEERRTIALYTATSASTRLELVAETTPWNAP